MIVCFLSERASISPAHGGLLCCVGFEPRADTGHTESDIPASHSEVAIAWIQLSHTRIGVDSRNTAGIALQREQVRVGRPSDERNLTGLVAVDYCVGDPLALPAVFLSEVSSSISGEHQGIRRWRIVEKGAPKKTGTRIGCWHGS